MNNRNQRTELLIGKENLSKLEKASVLIVGLGGVGGMASEMICRAGIGNMTIADCDMVNETNINRQIVALHSTINEAKAEILGKRLLDINPDLQLTIINDWLTSDNIESLLDTNDFDFVVDAIDTLSPKLFLIKSCIERNIPIVSSMGSGAKIDPAQIKIVDISKTDYCALAKAVRKGLADIGIKKGLPVVYSTEPANKNAIITTEGEKYKKSTTGTISYLPAIFGCYLASYVIRSLSGLKVPLAH